jgi:hypothetical protein
MVLDLTDLPAPATAPATAPTIAPEAAEVTLQAEAAATETPVAEQSAEPAAEIELIEQLWLAYRAQLDASIEQSTAAITAENARLAYEAAQEKTEVRRAAVKELLDSFCERLAEIRDPGSAALIEQVKSTMSEPEVKPASKGQMDYEQWKKLPTSVIVEIGVPGLGDKKAVQLVDAFPTLGNLEDARTESSKQHKHFCKVLGRGFGEKTADAIEEIMSGILMGDIAIPSNEIQSETAKASPEKAIEPAAQSTKSESQPSEVSDETIGDENELSFEPDDQPLSDAYDTDEIYEDLDGDEDEEDSDEEEALPYLDDDEDADSWPAVFHNELLTDPIETKSGWGDSDKTHSEAWSKGHKAQEDWPVSACPFDESDDLEQAKDWVRGWTAAAMLSMDL